MCNVVKKRSGRRNYGLKLFVFITVIVIMACQGASENDASVSANIEDSNLKMAKLLKSRHDNIDASKISYHLNSKRAQFYKGLISSGTNETQISGYKAQYAYEMLLSGSTEEAIIEIEKLLQELIAKKSGSEPIYRLKQLLGMAYMRLGEQENCIRKNNENSCIIPLKGDGIYSLRKGPETAISIYKQMLAERPDDKETIWLINIAYMALGEYPDGVPKQWLIDESNFTDEYPMQAFKNRDLMTVLDSDELAGGVSLEDFDNDGYLDIFCSSWGVNDQIRFFKNMANGEFEDRTSQTGLEGITGGLNMIHADYNNDGFVDVFVLRGAWYADQGRIPNSLLRNNGDGSFTDVTEEVGLLSFYPTQAASWIDFNLDGWLDLFIGNETTNNGSYPCELYINEGGKFRNIIDNTILKDVRGLIKAVTAGDINNDGLPDLYLSMVGSDNRLFKNTGWNAKAGTLDFVDITQSAMVAEPHYSFPCWMWDYNNDGYLDIFAAPFNNIEYSAAAAMTQHFMGHKVNGAQLAIYLNNGDESFTNISDRIGLSEPVFAMSGNYGDINNDGYLDFYLGTGTPNYSALVPNKMYLNLDGNSFTDVSYSTRLSHIQKGHGISFGDMDNDGDQDIFHVLGGAYEGDIFTNVYFENTLESTNRYIKIQFVGKEANRSAIGLRYEIVGKNKEGKIRKITRLVNTGGSFGANCLRQELGLGDMITVDSLKLIWPDKDQSQQIFKDLRLDSFIRIVQGVDTIQYLELNKIQKFRTS